MPQCSVVFTLLRPWHCWLVVVLLMFKSRAVQEEHQEKQSEKNARDRWKFPDVLHWQLDSWKMGLIGCSKMFVNNCLLTLL